MKKRYFLQIAFAVLVLFNACKKLDETGTEEPPVSTTVPLAISGANWINDFYPNVNYFSINTAAYDTDEGGTIMQTDAAGNIYTIGNFFQTMDADPGPGTAKLTAANGPGLFLTKYNSAGAYQWGKVIESAPGSSGFSGDFTPAIVPALALDNRGNVYITSRFSGTVSFGGNNTLTAQRLDAASVAQKTNTAFLAKYNTDGSFAWSKVVNDQSAISPIGRDITSRDLALDASGNIYLMGKFAGDLKFTRADGTSYSFSSSSANQSYAMQTYLVKYDNAGNVLWASVPVSSRSFIKNIAVDKNNDVIMGGEMVAPYSYTDLSGTLRYTNQNFSANLDAIIKVDHTAGRVAWINSATVGSSTAFSSKYSRLTTDSQGNIYFIDQKSLKKLGTDGTEIWSKSFNAPNPNNVPGQTGSQPNSGSQIGQYTLALNANNDVFITGSFFTTIDLGGGTLTGTSAVNIFVTKYTTAGTPVWSKKFSGPAAADSIDPFAINADGNGNINILGDYKFSNRPTTGRYLYLAQIKDQQ